MKTLEELERTERHETASKGKKKISVGMATCGIAAGARPVMTSFANELRTRGVKDVELTMMGCIGMCKLEPIVEVLDEEGNKTIYIEMTPEKAVRVVKEHIVGGNVCGDLTAK